MCKVNSLILVLCCLVVALKYAIARSCIICIVSTVYGFNLIIIGNLLFYSWLLCDSKQDVAIAYAVRVCDSVFCSLHSESVCKKTKRFTSALA